MRVVAVDPAPGKESTVFDGAFDEKRESWFPKLKARELREFLKEPRNRKPNTLICWDAPLTGPADPSKENTGTIPGDFTKRPIEKFFSRPKDVKDYCTPPGISVMGYAGCQHWTISRALLGLPRIGPFDVPDDKLPFRLVEGPGCLRVRRPSVVEIHPAVAAWLWCRRDWKENLGWTYKGSKGTKKSRDQVRERMWAIIVKKIDVKKIDFPPDAGPPRDDDEFDAAVGYILGRLFADKPIGGQVTLLGDRQRGSFLLPAESDLEDRWKGWIKKLNKKR